MHTPRPYKVWCREIVNVTKEVFWIFLHHLNVIPLPGVDDGTTASIKASDENTIRPSTSGSARPNTSSSKNCTDVFATLHFPQPRPPVPAAPYVGGVEWDATQYLATHLDLLNGLIASIPTREERNALRTELRASGFEKVMGGALRTCKEKFYGAVHDGLKTWIAAALADDWEVKTVRMGTQDQMGSPVKSANRSPVKPKKDNNTPPKLDMPKLELGFDKLAQKETIRDEWIGV
jgi:hypothetical protein